MDEKAIQLAAQKVALEREADVYLLNSPFNEDLTKAVLMELDKDSNRENAVMITVSYGGVADQAYRIARAFQTRYEKFTAVISGPCKSAGTICILGAHELAFTQYGELGPLDVQYAKKDEIGEFASGLVVTEALRTIRDDAFAAFEQTMLGITMKSGGRISFKLAAELATELAGKLFRAPVPADRSAIARRPSAQHDHRNGLW